ncbi:MAG: ABC transporter permease [Brevinema sp.]
MHKNIIFPKIKIILLKEKLFFIVLFIFVCSSIIYPYFLTYGNIINIMREYAVFSLIGMAQLIVILTGGINLSLGAVYAFTGILIALISTHYSWELSVLLPSLIIIFIGLLIGICVVAKLPSFIVTLAFASGIQGTIFILSNISQQNVIPVSSSVYLILKPFGLGIFFGLPIPFILSMTIAVILHIFLNYTKIGRVIYATGSNDVYAEYMGLPIKLARIVAYIIASILTFVAGTIGISRLGSAAIVAGVGYEMYGVLMVVLGGALITGGYGSVKNTLLGVFIYVLIQNIFNMQGNIDIYIRNILFGATLVFILILQEKLSKKGKVI